MFAPSYMFDRVLNAPLKYPSNWVSHACRDLPKVYQTLLGLLHLQYGCKKIKMAVIRKSIWL